MTRLHRQSARLLLGSAGILLYSLTLAAQTPIELSRNSYTPEQDVQIGRQAADEIRRQLPLLDDRATNRLVEGIGERLVRQIPAEFRQPVFRYSFEVVNLRDINAFALPGGPMFLHRGIIEAAKTDAEVAGVMAHELAHVVLRHGTAQATRGERLQLGAIAGQVIGSIIGGRVGNIFAHGTQIGAGMYFLRYSREFEREADLLGAQIMARAGYDPRQMANMFQTIQEQGGGRGPEWMSSHPDPGNRYEAINREAAMLEVAGSAGTAAAFEQARASLARLPQAPTLEQVARAEQQGQGGPMGTTGRIEPVAPPSSQWRTYQPGDFLRVAVPANWQEITGDGTVTYAPPGGYHRAQSGQSAFTHGVQVGVAPADGGNLQQNTDQLLQLFARANPQLRRQGGYSRTTIGGRQGLTTTLSNVSEVTGARETVNVSTVQLRDGSILFIVGVAPADEARTYLDTFSRVRQSMQIAER
jgi:beta-barrel assembly-enhancing protease